MVINLVLLARPTINQFSLSLSLSLSLFRSTNTHNILVHAIAVHCNTHSRLERDLANECCPLHSVLRYTQPFRLPLVSSAPEA